jgi:thiopurine S-methyltransferase
MATTEWHERWSKREIGFHEGRPNEHLVNHIARFGKARRLMVPLAGKAIDLRALSDAGHDVVGVEFVRTAIDEFFSEWQVTPTPHTLGAHEAFYGKGVTLVRADMFAVNAGSLGRFEGIYDRAALVAIEPSRRADYVKVCRDLLQPGAGILLIAFSYDQTKIQGPPWSVDESEVRALYAGCTIEKLAAKDLPVNPRFAAAGVSTLHEAAYWIVTPRP